MTLILSGVKDVAAISKGPQALWLNAVNVIPENHLCVESDTGFAKLGDGNLTYPELSYVQHDCTGNEENPPVRVRISCIDAQLMGINLCEQGVLEPPSPPTLDGRLEDVDGITGGPETPQDDGILIIKTLDADPNKDTRAIIKAGERAPTTQP